MTLIEQIKELMKGKGMTQKELAQRCGISESQISQYLNGNTDMSVSKAERIAEELDSLLRLVQK